ncbi:hypothetical protein AB0F15_19310 [Amycolatopsis sp. NPDC026612]|uniref:hypothetical protein n=1 Tax=Amycolatopsis sp. NPDC026612 TaxID=3155466 RepID=UPI0033C76B86
MIERGYVDALPDRAEQVECRAEAVVQDAVEGIGPAVLVLVSAVARAGRSGGLVEAVEHVLPNAIEAVLRVDELLPDDVEVHQFDSHRTVRATVLPTFQYRHDSAPPNPDIRVNRGGVVVVCVHHDVTNPVQLVPQIMGGGLERVLRGDLAILSDDVGCG